jgi:hypothetical protein
MSSNVMEYGHWVMLFKFSNFLSNFISNHHSIYSINFYRGNGFCIKIIIKKLIYLQMVPQIFNFHLFVFPLKIGRVNSFKLFYWILSRWSLQLSPYLNYFIEFYRDGPSNYPYYFSLVLSIPQGVSSKVRETEK